ncbi:hypothetical protein ACERK3_13110 [Phycisphaerales bacterium AB-hyl4]|uniref:Uncharacterized protein n=1 Tax=Natronomicrosphaera hydrolytica TaxID=3242702 RepID=A0ABV4U6K4_9BACT
MTTTTVQPSREGKLSSVSQYLKPISSQSIKRKIRHHMKAKLQAAGSTEARPMSGSMNAAKREMLYDSIFVEENRLESQQGGKPDDPLVIQLRAARNRVADDLGWND